MEYSPNNRVFRGYKLNQKYNDIYQKSIQSREEFWKNISENIFWYKKPTKILNSSNPPFYKWFEDGVTNTCYNALDLHIDDGRGDKIALIYDSPITGSKKKKKRRLTKRRTTTTREERCGRRSRRTRRDAAGGTHVDGKRQAVFARGLLLPHAHVDRGLRAGGLRRGGNRGARHRDDLLPFTWGI